MPALCSMYKLLSPFFVHKAAVTLAARVVTPGSVQDCACKTKQPLPQSCCSTVQGCILSGIRTKQKTTMKLNAAANIILQWHVIACVPMYTTIGSLWPNFAASVVRVSDVAATRKCGSPRRSSWGEAPQAVPALLAPTVAEHVAQVCSSFCFCFSPVLAS